MNQTAVKWTLLLALTVLSFPVSADVAVLLRITHTEVTVQRIERSDPTESDLSDEIIKRRALALNSKTGYKSLSLIVVEWYDELGQLLHTEFKPDPRFLHAPGGGEAVMPEALVLVRAPSNAVRLRVRPRNSGKFFAFDV